MATTGLLSAGGALFPSTARGPAGHLPAGKGILGYTPVTPSTTVRRGAVDVPMDLSMFEGSNKYANYVRAWPDLLNHYLNNIPEDTQSMADWGREHWVGQGSKETDAYMLADKGKTPMEAWRARGMWGDTPLPRTALGPGRFQASQYLPAMDAGYDPRAGTTETTFSAGVPMPEVKGYKYAYRPYEWDQGSQSYSELAYNEYDQSKYPYYPYMPSGGRAPDKNDRILVGVRLVPE
jgi:hypothetical protein